MIVVVPDINVLVSKLYADKAAKSSRISQKVVLHLVSGSINGEPVQIAMSFKTLDTRVSGPGIGRSQKPPAFVVWWVLGHSRLSGAGRRDETMSVAKRRERFAK
jgi:hypothetical protein